MTYATRHNPLLTRNGRRTRAIVSHRADPRRARRQIRMLCAWQLRTLPAEYQAKARDHARRAIIGAYAMTRKGCKAALAALAAHTIA